jgi:hypothetical protein
MDGYSHAAPVEGPAEGANGLIDPGEPVPGDILDAARALQAAGFVRRAVR